MISLQGIEVVASHRKVAALSLSVSRPHVKTCRGGYQIHGDIGCLMPLVSCRELSDLDGWIAHFKRLDVPFLVVFDEGARKYRLYKERRCEVGPANMAVRNWRQVTGQ